MCRVTELKRANKIVQAEITENDEQQLILMESNNDLEQSTLSFFNISHFERLEAVY